MSNPFFLQTGPRFEAPALSSAAKPLRADVVVVGAGIAGLTTAYLLALDGRSVIVLDRGQPGHGMTGRTTAHLSNSLDDFYHELIRRRGEDAARLAAESHSTAIDLIEEIQAKESIACDFKRLDGWLFLEEGGDPAVIDRELDGAHRAGLAGVEKHSAPPIPTLQGRPCLRFPHLGRMHAMKYLAGLAEAIQRLGGRIYSGALVQQVEGGDRAGVVTDTGVGITGDHVVVATNVPINDRVTIHTKQAPYRTYVIAAAVPGGAIPDALYWDTGDPYHYVRLQPGEGGGDWLIVGGEDHKTGQASDDEERLQRLEAWARRCIPAMKDVAFRWSGQVMEPFDFLAYIGRNPGDAPNVYIATGDSGMGITHGTLAGMIISDLIAGRENRFAALYDPGRKLPELGTEYLKENLNVVAQFKDYVTGGDVSSEDEIASGEGAVIRDGIRKVAVYRDEHGKLYRHSAVCPHLGCLVAWNKTERLWECPCHGSRFGPDGQVLNGPASAPLSPA